ncbi:MAG: TraV family lipoprotein [Sideroxyarcus sp.]|nr:TraV family lipoprotein [Sideroxyarcus sp.]
MRALFPLVCLLMAGCAGVDSESHFKCQAPEGIGCSSLSGTYANALEDNLPGSPVKKSATYDKDGEKEHAITGAAPQTGTPILSAPVVLRIWVAPWEDGRKVLHDQAYLYAVVDPGHWQIEHNKKRISEQYRVLAPAARKVQPQEPMTRQPQFQPPGAESSQQNGVN